MIHWLKVNDPRHTEVLGYRVSTKAGKALWDELYWSDWRLDGPGAHVFNAGGMYFHVKARNVDGEEVWYRVRCFYAGGKYKGKAVKSVGVGRRSSCLHWIVRTEDKK